MKKYGVLTVILFALGAHLQLAGRGEVNAAVLSGAFDNSAISDAIASQLNHVSAAGILMAREDANGSNGEDDDEKDKEGEDAEGFDRLWDVVLYG